MDLRSHSPYWLLKNGLINSYASLQQNIITDIAVIGAGISGALVAYYTSAAGYNTVVIDRRHPGMGSTAASTALLQYELDVPLHQLIKKIGNKNAVHAYKLCLTALADLRQICSSLKRQVIFSPRPSLQYASNNKHKHELNCEFTTRLQNKFDVSWLEKKDIEDMFGFDAPGAILSADAAEIDAYLLTHALLEAATEQQCRTFSNTAITNIQREKNHLLLHTDTGFCIAAKKIVVACGYETLEYIRKQIGELQSTYALISEPLIQKNFWYQNSIIWETSIPYMYMRTTDDNRVIIGGKDDPFYNPSIRDARIGKKTDMLIRAFQKKFPHLLVRKDFAWAGTFVTTEDGLPFIGTLAGENDIYYALGYGGNGITFSVIAAQIILDLIKGKSNKDAGLFSFNRL